MDLALMLSAALLGLAGAPHCAAMCGAACVAASGGTGRWSTAGFQLGRLISYSLAGALAAASVGTLARLGQWSPTLKPLWIGVHVLALGLGIWLLWRGAQPRWVSELVLTNRWRGASGGAQTVMWSPARRGARAGFAGLAWVAWPCGLLQSALVVAALGNHAVSGAAAMAGFALTSSLGLLAAPWLLQGMARLTNDRESVQRLLTRTSGALLSAASFWALTHGLWQRFAAWCFA